MRSESDEKYVLDLIAEILGENYKWQQRFDTLLGDPGKNGRRVKLPVDAYFSESKLIVEYKEKQHFEAVNIMDRRLTVSGVNRGEQRKIYDLRKEKWADDNNIRFLTVSYIDLTHKNNGKLLRRADDDRVLIESLIGRVLR